MSTTTHRTWCNRDECVEGAHPKDTTMHYVRLDGTDDFWMDITQFEGNAAMLGVGGEADMTLPQVDELIKALTVARERLARVH